jgi:hypothetical protein
LNAQRSPLLAIAAAMIPTLVVFQPPAFGNPQAQETKGTQIEVRLFPIKKSIKVGEVLRIQVEIRNVGSETLFIENSIYSPCMPPTPLSLRFDLGPPLNRRPGPDSAARATVSTQPRTVSRGDCYIVGQFSRREIFTAVLFRSSQNPFRSSLHLADGD